MTIDTFYNHRYPFRSGKRKKFLNRINTGIANIFMPLIYKTHSLKPLKKTAEGEEEIIITLTSYGERVKSVDKCIESLMRQNFSKAFRVVLWLSEDEFKSEDNLPKGLKRLKEFGLEIYFVPDIRSYKKIYYAAKRYKNALLVTADDDFWYPSVWLKELYETHQKHPDCVACHRAHEILFDDNNNLLPYDNWNWFSCGIKGPSYSLSPLSGAGLMFPENFFDKEFFDKEKMMEYAPTTDDMWIAFTMFRQGIALCKVRPYTTSLISIMGSQKVTLYDTNKGNTQKDIIGNLVKLFNIDMYKVCTKKYEREEKNKILVVSPCFPPEKAIGALRMGSLCEHLVENNWDVTVMRALNTDTDALPSVEGVKLVSVDTRKIFGNMPGQAHKRQRFSQPKAGKVYKNALKELLKKQTFDVMVISMGPFFDLPLCNIAKKNSLPCVLDFRDPGALAEPNLQRIQGLEKIMNKFYLLSLKKNEKKAVKDASSVVTVVPGWRSLYEKTYGSHPGKTLTIENGFDEKKLDTIELPERKEKADKELLTIACFGKFGYHAEKYTPEFLQALVELNKRGRKVHLLHIGGLTQDLKDNLDKIKLPEGMYENIPFMEYALGMQKLSEADVLVNVDMRKDAIGTKIYDYVYLNRPILYVGPPESEQYKLIKTFEHGFSCDKCEEVVVALEEIADKKYENLQNDIDLSSYGRKAQNQKYEALLNKFVIRD